MRSDDRDKVVTIRVSEGELERLHVLAKHLDVTVSQMLRRLARDEYARVAPPDTKRAAKAK
jgi:hypothetical protein